MKRALSIVSLLVILFLSFTACSKGKDTDEPEIPAINDDEPVADEDEEEEVVEEVKEIQYVIYVRHNSLPIILGEKLSIKENDIRLKGKTIEEIALEDLMNFESEGLVSPMPQDTELLGIEKENGIVTVNLSKQFIDNMEEDTETTRVTIDAIVATITFLEGNDKVIIIVEGQRVEELNGVNMDKAFELSSEFFPTK